MIQLIMKDGSRRRVDGNISDTDINPDDIEHQKVLKKNEIFMIPEIKNGKITMRDKSSTELATEQSIKDEKNEISLLNKQVANEMRANAKVSLVARKEMTQEQADKLE